MRELFPTDINANPPSELVAPGAERPGWRHVKVEKGPETLNEILHKLHFDTNNIRHEDGRINGGKDHDGNDIAYFVSPYAKNFWANVEPKIEPLVRALKAKRYLTYSSCQGHCKSSRRYVGIAFADTKSREDFCRAIEAARIPGVYLNRIETIVNQAIYRDSDGVVRVERSLNREQPDKENEAIGFNFAFGRDYDNYCFVELIICKQFPTGRPHVFALRHPIKYGLDYWRKVFFWDRLTKRVVDLVRSDTVPKYKY